MGVVGLAEDAGGDGDEGAVVTGVEPHEVKRVLLDFMRILSRRFLRAMLIVKVILSE